MGNEPIAIVGASCRFPGADGLDAFWQLLVTGVDAVSEVDAARWATRYFYHPNGAERGKSYTWAAGLIDRVDRFEPSFFGISPREAMQMDPQQRILLELVWHAFEDAGIPPVRLRGSDTGVYIGASATDYSDLTLGDPAAADTYFMTGNALSILANRISYVFDLRGPSLTIDTACSSSLVALHYACEAIRAGEVASAIVGGVNLLLTPYPFLGFCRASMLSRRGRCFAFDERADGYVRAEGAGVVLLKPMAQAVADRDPIRAVVVATGCNSDGRTVGLSLPSEAAQSALLQAVYQRAGIAADDLVFVEMHGTGTPVGDPVEAAAVGNVLGSRRRVPLPIGSVKSNIGHLEPASGMAGLLKAALALDRGMVPATLNCQSPNPKIDFAGLNLRLVRTAEPIAQPQKGGLAGVNSFGFGGTNAHAILAAPPAPTEPAGSKPVLPPLVVSAATEASLRELAGRWGAALARTPDRKLPDRVRAAARGREHRRHRLALAVTDRSSAANALLRFHADAPTPEIASGRSALGGRLAFVYAGNGAQFPGMGRAALGASAAFRAAIERVDRILQPELGWSIFKRIEAGVDEAAVARADIAQPVLFAIQVGIVEALRVAGIAAEGHLGHSVGEITAAWAAGALSLADAASVIIVRSRSQQRTRGSGRMAALALGGEEARGLLAELGSDAEIAAYNTARSVTVSGSAEEIARLVAAARDRGLWCRPLDLDFAFHSRLMEPVREEVFTGLAGLRSRPAMTRLLSTVTGAAVEHAALDAEHWWRNIRSPVQFAEAVAGLVAEGFCIFVEIGPNPILQAYLLDGLRAAEAEGHVLASLTRRDDDADPFAAIAAQCFVAGYDWPSAPLFDGNRDPRGLPLYPWDRQPYWFDKTAESADFHDPPFDHPLLGFRQRGPLPNWLNHVDPHVLPWLADHKLEGVAVYPAAAVVEAALAAAHRRWPDAPVVEAAEIELRRPLTFDTAHMRELRMALASEDGDWQLTARPRLSDEAFQLYAVGRIAAGRQLLAGARPAAEIAARIVDKCGLYRLARQSGLDYGTSFQTVDHVDLIAADRAIVHLEPARNDDRYLLHPGLLDGALQGFLALLSGPARRDIDAPHDPAEGFLPWRFERVRLAAPFGRACQQAHLHLRRVGVRAAAADLVLYDEAGAVVAELTGCWFRRVALGRHRPVGEQVFRVDLVPAPLDRGAAPAVLSATGAMLERLAAAHEPEPARLEQGALLEAAIGAAGFEVWRDLAAPAASFTVRELIDAGCLSASSNGLAESLLRAVERIGGASEANGRWRIDAEANLPGAAEIWRLLLAEAPDLVAELAVLGAALDQLPELLADGPKPAQSGQPGIGFVDHLLQASPASAAGIEVLARALHAIAADWPRERPLRILEIGAEGEATRRFLDCLADSAAAFAYIATSADPEKIERLKAITRPFAGASARHWTPETSLAAGDDEQFDIVLAVNSCARLGLDITALSMLRELVSPGGFFVAVEPEPNAVWDLAFGRRPEWWLDQPRGGAISPLRARAGWEAVLAGAGFETVASAPVAVGPWPIAAFWGKAPADPDPDAIGRAPSAAGVAITLVAEDSPLRRALADRLAAAGHRMILSPPEPGAPPTGGESGRTAEIAVFLAEKVASTAAVARQLAALARLAHHTAAAHAALWVVTCDAHQPTPEPGTHSLAAAAVWGFARVLANELPRLCLRLIDLAGRTSPERQARQVAGEIAAASPETEIVWTPSGRHVLRLRQGLPRQPRSRAKSQALKLASAATGGLHSLHWAARTLSAPGSGEVEIEVHAAGLNFRDVMWAMGLLPEEALIDGFAGPSFGLECAGIVRAVGAGVDGLTVGDRVMAFAPAALGTRVTTVADAVTPIPAELDFAAAATLPVAFVTVIYALGRLARIEPGEHVLIHAASGGVGLAAIQYAKQRGAVVVATAGSETKRSFLRLAGADHVLNSRDLGFADAVRRITAGAGVDVVLNSLSGEAMERSLELLKPFGRFLELGKRDFYLNHRLHLRPLRHNIAYFAVDIDQLPLRRPALARSLLDEISKLLAAGAIRPLAYRVFRYSEVGEAFRLVQASGHIGKVVLVPDPEGELPARDAPRFPARRDGTYLVTGGLEGFGFEAARWLVSQGAGAIALVGRRGLETPGCDGRVAELRAAGAEVRIYRADVADPAALAAVLSEVRAVQPPLRGIVHAAAVIDDRLSADIASADLVAALRPKLDGAVALDRLTRDDPIELFLLFSSATTLLGAPGQGAYVAANMALEAVARRRHAEGRPGLAVAWGPIEDAGYLAQRPQTREALARRLGAVPITAAEALAALPAMLASGQPAIAFAAPGWGEAGRSLPILATPLFSEVRYGADPAAGDDALIDKLRRLEPDAAQALLQHVVAEETGRILRLPPSEIDLARPLAEMGMDSLMAVELRLALESRLRIDLPLVSLVEGTSIASVAVRLGSALVAGADAAEVAALAERHLSRDEMAAPLENLGAPKSAAE